MPLNPCMMPHLDDKNPTQIDKIDNYRRKINGNLKMFNIKMNDMLEDGINGVDNICQQVKTCMQQHAADAGNGDSSPEETDVGKKVLNSQPEESKKSKEICATKRLHQIEKDYQKVVENLDMVEKMMACISQRVSKTERKEDLEETAEKKPRKVHKKSSKNKVSKKTSSDINIDETPSKIKLEKKILNQVAENFSGPNLNEHQNQFNSSLLKIESLKKVEENLDETSEQIKLEKKPRTILRKESSEQMKHEIHELPEKNLDESSSSENKLEKKPRQILKKPSNNKIPEGQNSLNEIKIHEKLISEFIERNLPIFEEETGKNLDDFSAKKRVEKKSIEVTKIKTADLKERQYYEESLSKILNSDDDSKNIVESEKIFGEAPRNKAANELEKKVKQITKKAFKNKLAEKNLTETSSEIENLPKIDTLINHAVQELGILLSDFDTSRNSSEVSFTPKAAKLSEFPEVTISTGSSSVSMLGEDAEKFELSRSFQELKDCYLQKIKNNNETKSITETATTNSKIYEEENPIYEDSEELITITLPSENLNTKIETNAEQIDEETLQITVTLAPSPTHLGPSPKKTPIKKQLKSKKKPVNPSNSFTEIKKASAGAELQSHSSNESNSSLNTKNWKRDEMENADGEKRKFNVLEPILMQCKKMFCDLTIEHVEVFDLQQTLKTGAFNSTLLRYIIEGPRRPKSVRIHVPAQDPDMVSIIPDVHRKKAVSNLHDQMEIQIHQTDSFDGFLNLMNKNRRKALIRHAEKQDHNVRCELKNHYFHKRYPLKIVTTPMIPPHGGSSTMSDKKKDADRKYINSLWFSPKNFKLRRNSRIFNRKRMEMYCQNLHKGPAARSKVSRSDDQTARGKSSATSASNYSILVRSGMPIGRRPYTPRRWIRTNDADGGKKLQKLHHCDILDDLTVDDLAPFNAEYPRHDEKHEIRKSLIYQLAHGGQGQDGDAESALLELVAPPTPTIKDFKENNPEQNAKDTMQNGKETIPSVKETNSNSKPKTTVSAKKQTAVKKRNNNSEAIVKSINEIQTISMNKENEVKARKSSMRPQTFSEKSLTSNKSSKGKRKKQNNKSKGTINEKIKETLVMKLSAQSSNFPSSHHGSYNFAPPKNPALVPFKTIYPFKKPVKLPELRKGTVNRLLTPYIANPDKKNFQNVTVLPITVEYTNEPFKIRKQNEKEVKLTKPSAIPRSFGHSLSSEDVDELLIPRIKSADNYVFQNITVLPVTVQYNNEPSSHEFAPLNSKVSCENVSKILIPYMNSPDNRVFQNITVLPVTVSYSNEPFKVCKMLSNEQKHQSAIISENSGIKKRVVTPRSKRSRLRRTNSFGNNNKDNETVSGDCRNLRKVQPPWIPALKRAKTSWNCLKSSSNCIKTYPQKSKATPPKVVEPINNAKLPTTQLPVCKYRSTSDIVPPSKTRNKLEGSIQKTINIIEEKMVDILTTNDQERKKRTINKMEKEITRVLNMINEHQMAEVQHCRKPVVAPPPIVATPVVEAQTSKPKKRAVSRVLKYQPRPSTVEEEETNSNNFEEAPTAQSAPLKTELYPVPSLREPHNVKYPSPSTSSTNLSGEIKKIIKKKSREPYGKFADVLRRKTKFVINMTEKFGHYSDPWEQEMSSFIPIVRVLPSIRWYRLRFHDKFLKTVFSSSPSMCLMPALIPSTDKDQNNNELVPVENKPNPFVKTSFTMENCSFSLQPDEMSSSLTALMEFLDGLTRVNDTLHDMKLKNKIWIPQQQSCIEFMETVEYEEEQSTEEITENLEIKCASTTEDLTETDIPKCQSREELMEEESGVSECQGEEQFEEHSEIARNQSGEELVDYTEISKNCEELKEFLNETKKIEDFISDIVKLSQVSIQVERVEEEKKKREVKNYETFLKIFYLIFYSFVYFTLTLNFSC